MSGNSPWGSQNPQQPNQGNQPGGWNGPQQPGGGPASAGSPQSAGQSPFGGQPNPGAPQFNQPGQPGQYGQQPYGQQGQQYGQQPQPGQQPAYGQYNQTSGGGGGGNKLLLPILIGAGALVLVIAVIAAVVGLGGGQDPVAGGGGGGTGGKTEGGTQSEVVQQYLEAVAAGDAAGALALAETQPTAATFLTNEALAASAKNGAITDIQVAQSSSEYSSRVEASFKIGDQQVTEEFSVRKVGDGYKLDDPATEVDLTNRRARTLPMLIDGTEVTTDKIRLFPGAYQFSTGTDYIGYGDELVYVKSNDDYRAASSIESPTITEKGTEAYIAAIDKSVKACLAKKELKPSGCPNQTSANGQKIKTSTIKWSVRSGSTENLKPRLDYDNPTTATAYVGLSFKIEAECDGGTCTGSSYAGRASVDLTAEELAVKWDN